MTPYSFPQNCPRMSSGQSHHIILSLEEGARELSKGEGRVLQIIGFRNYIYAMRSRVTIILRLLIAFVASVMAVPFTTIEKGHYSGIEDGITEVSIVYTIMFIHQYC